MAIELWTAAIPNSWKGTILIEQLKGAGVELPASGIGGVELPERD